MDPGDSKPPQKKLTMACSKQEMGIPSVEEGSRLNFFHLEQQQEELKSALETPLKHLLSLTLQHTYTAFYTLIATYKHSNPNTYHQLQQPNLHISHSKRQN